MAKNRRKTISEMIAEKFSFIDKSEFDFLDGIESMEIAIYSKLLDILRRFAQEEGRIIELGSNAVLFDRLKREILKVIRESTFIPKVSNFLTKFDGVEKRNRTIYERILGVPVKTDLMLEKLTIIDKVTDSLTGQSSLNANFINPIRKTLTDAVRFNQTFAEAEANLRTQVKGTGSGGLFKRYTTQVVRDSINGFDGAVNDVIRDAFQLDGLRYVGSEIDDTRLNCQELLRGSGAFEKFAIRPGTYRESDLQSIIDIAKNRPGWNPATTKSTFAQYRCGYNCRHAVYWFRLKPEEKQKT
jgi:hypothetical protein